MTQVQEHVPPAEADLIHRAAAGEEAAIRAIMRANNRRLYRLARSVVRDDSEAEDVLQDAYVKAFAAIGAYRQDAALATWLSRIVLNEALQRRRRKVEAPADPSTRSQALVIPFPMQASPPIDPERAMAQREMCILLEQAIDQLPDDYRGVLIARGIEGMSIQETAQLLDIRPETVKTRLHRARALLRSSLAEHIGDLIGDVFPFAGWRCDRLTEAVVARLRQSC